LIVQPPPSGMFATHLPPTTHEKDSAFAIAAVLAASRIRAVQLEQVGGDYYQKS